mmetsp:Transcript_17610/g.36773  ORF Transcript_17610/g.36773 Transcript_17610/m.36773 type:complete len:257 (-) Transcript_17610:1691-2461(-)
MDCSAKDPSTGTVQMNEETVPVRLVGDRLLHLQMGVITSTDVIRIIRTVVNAIATMIASSDVNVIGITDRGRARRIIIATIPILRDRHLPTATITTINTTIEPNILLREREHHPRQTVIVVPRAEEEIVINLCIQSITFCPLPPGITPGTGFHRRPLTSKVAISTGIPNPRDRRVPGAVPPGHHPLSSVESLLQRILCRRLQWLEGDMVNHGHFKMRTLRRGAIATTNTTIPLMLLTTVQIAVLVSMVPAVRLVHS